MAKIITEIPNNAIGPIINGVILYWATGMHNDATKFLNFEFILIFLILILVTLLMLSSAAIYFACCIAAIAPDPEVGTAMVPLFVIIFFLFSG